MSSQRTALITHVREFAGAPAQTALLDAGFRVCVHDVSFADPAVRIAYAAAYPAVEVLAEQTPPALIGALDRLDVLVSNDAYPAVHAPLVAARAQDLRDTLERLVVFPFELMQSAMPRLLAADQARVVMITSSRTRLQAAGGAIPDAARAAINALVKSFSLELAPHQVPINAIAPNFLYSETYFPRAHFIDSADGQQFVRDSVPMGRLGQPEEIGELIAYLATMQGSFLTGAIIDFTGGWPAARPRPV